MSTFDRDDAVMRRLGRLRDQYRAFTADPGARLLRWVIEDDERRMIDALVATEHDARLQQLPDLLVVLSSAFGDPQRHGFALRHELVAQHEHARERAAQGDAELDASVLDWEAPAPSPGLDDVEALVEATASFVAHHTERLVHLTLVLQPASIADGTAWCEWLLRVVARLPERVRVIVLEREDAPMLERLDAEEPTRVVTRRAALDMDGAYLALSEGRKEDRSPDAEIRRAYVRMMIAGKHGDVEGAVGIGTPALHAAQREGWWDLAASLQLAMGSLYHAHGQPEAACERFGRAEAEAARSEARGDAAGGSLRVQALMARGCALLRLERWSEAARTYQQAAGLAEARGDVLMAHDAWRLAGCAHERARATDDAWRSWAHALRVGESMQPGERRCSTLPHTGQALLRLADEGAPPPDVGLPRRTLSQRLDAVLGAGWRASA